MAVLKWRAEEAARSEAATTGRSEESSGEAADGGEAGTEEAGTEEEEEEEERRTVWELDCDVKVDAMLQVPSPLSIVPRPVRSHPNLTLTLTLTLPLVLTRCVPTRTLTSRPSVAEADGTL